MIRTVRTPTGFYKEDDVTGEVIWAMLRFGLVPFPVCLGNQIREFGSKETLVVVRIYGGDRPSFEARASDGSIRRIFLADVESITFIPSEVEHLVERAA